MTGDGDLLQHAPPRAWLDKRGITVLTQTQLVKRLADIWFGYASHQGGLAE